MNIIEAILLGLIQGLSEFIPISSTAHLTLAAKFFGLIDPNNPEKWTAFMAVIQLGTLAAVLIYFYKDILNITKSFVNENLIKRVSFKQQSINSRLGWYICAGSVPIVALGLVLKKLISGNFTKDLNVIAFSLVGLAIILFIADRVSKKNKSIENVNLKDSLLIGLSQVLALIPGSSRSGTTITAGLFLGFTRESAARFSFLLSIPAILGSGLYEFYSEYSLLTNDMLISTLVATLVSFISGYFAIDFLIKYLKKNNTNLFVIYRIVLGIVILIMINK